MLHYITTNVGIISATLLLLCVIFILILYCKRDTTQSKVENNAKKNKADIIILVGSESNKTWGFATHLHNTLTTLNINVRTTSMNELEKRYKNAQHLLILTSTFGDGKAPESAQDFLHRLENLTHSSNLRYAVLGFGSHHYPKFCQYAKDVDNVLKAKGLSSFMPLTLIDNQSSLQFSHWGRALSEQLNRRFKLTYIQSKPKTSRFKLIEKTDFDPNAPISILRFEIPNRCSSFEAGDLLGIFAPNTEIERYYSLGSNNRLGFLEFCVRKQEQGVCSTYLTNLRVGQSIEGFIKANPGFKVKSNTKPLILIGAGTGIGPLIGFIRENINKRPIYLYWGARHPDTDFLYKYELQTHLENKRLTQFTPAFSRIKNASYVQNKLSLDSNIIQGLIQKDAQIMVCGSTKVAGEIEDAINRIIRPIGKNSEQLKGEKRYLEDIY